MSSSKHQRERSEPSLFPGAEAEAVEEKLFLRLSPGRARARDRQVEGEPSSSARHGHWQCT